MIRPKIIFKNPKKNDIAVFFVDEQWTTNMILQDLSRTNIGSHEQELYITPSIIVRFLIQLRHFNFDLIKYEKLFIGKLKRVRAELFCHYWIACVSQTGAKIVLCFADNYLIYQRISILDHDRVYYAIQNGIRTVLEVRDRVPIPGVISMTNFFCFGQRDVDLFSKHNHLIKNWIPVGSLIGGYYKSQISGKNCTKKEFDICFISQLSHVAFNAQYDNESITGKFYKILIDSHKILFKYLNNYIKEKNCSVVVCLRSESDDEANMYKNYISDDCSFIYRDRPNFATYRGADKSNLSISLFSTVLAEVFSWGQKVLYCNMLKSEWMEMPEAGISYFCKNDYDTFKKRIDELLKMDIDDYRKLTYNNSKYICNYKPDQPAHEIIRSTILKEIK